MVSWMTSILSGASFPTKIICCGLSSCFGNKGNANTSTNSAKAIWDFEGIFCSSRHIPHVRFAGLIHPGILGCAPSAEILAEWNKREGELIATHSHLGRDVAKPPEQKYAHAGGASSEIKEKVAREGARTIPVYFHPDGINHCLPTGGFCTNKLQLGPTRKRR